MGRKKVMKWRKNHPADDSSGKREYRDDRKDIELHGGSYPLEEVKAMPEYKNMVEQTSSKKTYALNIGYCGTSYQGLQTNEGAITIEGLLERALFLSGGIKECNFGNLQKVGWTRAARTDKGVHAIGQCVSMRLTVDSEPDFIQQVNTCLPEDIRLFAMTKTTKSFNARLHCSHRRYEYLLPTYLLQAWQSTEYMKEFIESLASPNTALSEEQLREVRTQLVQYRLDADMLARFRSNLKKLEGTHSFHNFTSSKTVQISNDSQVKRFMMDISCEEPFLHTCEDGTTVEWIKVSLLGQSFLLNQIRKMIGLVVDATRGAVPESMFEQCFDSKNKVTVAMVPGLGLFLYELFFDRYNTKLECEDERLDVSKKRKAEKMEEKSTANESEEEPKIVAETEAGGSGLQKLTWSADPTLAAAMANFRDTKITPQIFAEEDRNLVFMNHLEYLRTAQSIYKVAEGGS